MPRTVVLLSCLLLFCSCARENQPLVPLDAYVPGNTALVIKINNLHTYKDSLSQHPLLGRLGTLEPFDHLFASLSFLDLVPQESKGILAMGETGELLYITENFDINPTDSIALTRIEELSLAQGTVTKYQLKNQDFFAVNSGRNLLLGTHMKTLVAALDRAKLGRADTMFSKLFGGTDPNAMASVILNWKTGDSITTKILRSDSAMDWDQFADWVSLDLTVTGQDIHLQGLTIVDTAHTSYFELFKNTRPVPNTSATLAPYATDALISYSFDDFGTFQENQKAYLNDHTLNDSLFGAVEEIALAQLGNEKAVILSTYDSETLIDFIDQLQRNTYDYQGTAIRELVQHDFLNSALKPLVAQFQAKYCAIIDNAFIFAKNNKVLETIIGDFNRGNTFAQSVTYSNAQKTMAAAASVLYIGNAKHTQKLLGQNLQSTFFPADDKTSFRDYAMTLQIVADGKLFLTNLGFAKLTEIRPNIGPQTLFELPLDTTVSMAPQFVTNHLNREKEIVVQDDRNQLYLISQKGTVLWKKQLDGSIRGRVHQVDLFHNGRLQLLFTTDRQLVTLDRNGKEVQMLTKTFQGAELNPLAVFDYEKNMDYRILVTQGDKLFMYDRKGNIVSGFKYTQSKSPIIGTPKHLVIGNKDHIVLRLADGSLKILNRRGTERVPVSEKFQFSENETFIHQNRFVLTDQEGKLYHIDQKGTITAKALSLNPEHGFVSTDNTLVFQNDNLLNINEKRTTLDLGVYTAPKVFSHGDRTYISVTDLQNQKVYLFNDRSVPIANFPVMGYGAAELTTFKSKGKLLLVCTKDSKTLIMYQLN